MGLSVECTLFAGKINEGEVMITKKYIKKLQQKN
jgi:hypothetical protein